MFYYINIITCPPFEVLILLYNSMKSIIAKHKFNLKNNNSAKMFLFENNKVKIKKQNLLNLPHRTGIKISDPIMILQNCLALFVSQDDVVITAASEAQPPPGPDQVWLSPPLLSHLHQQGSL